MAADQTGHTRQNMAALHSGLAGKRFGAPDLSRRMFATGLCALADSVRLNAAVEIVGDWSVR